jgi:hypothetical protein
MQFLGVVGLIGLMKANRKWEWQRKFMDYRILAEMFRLLRYLYPLGIVFSGLKAPVDHRRSFTWINYQFRSVLRGMGTPDPALNRERMKDSLQQFLSGIDGQILFHANSAKRCAGVARKLNDTASILFIFGLCLIAVRIGIQYYYPGDSVGEKFLKNYYNMLALMVPALSAYVYALLTGLGFERLQDRSLEMTVQLEKNKTAIHALLKKIEKSDPSLCYEDVRLLAQGSIKANILDELSEWRIFVNSKSITVM